MSGKAVGRMLDTPSKGGAQFGGVGAGINQRHPGRSRRKHALRRNSVGHKPTERGAPMHEWHERNQSAGNEQRRHRHANVSAQFPRL